MSCVLPSPRSSVTSASLGLLASHAAVGMAGSSPAPIGTTDAQPLRTVFSLHRLKPPSLYTLFPQKVIFASSWLLRTMRIRRQLRSRRFEEAAEVERLAQRRNNGMNSNGIKPPVLLVRDSHILPLIAFPIPLRLQLGALQLSLGGPHVAFSSLLLHLVRCARLGIGVVHARRRGADANHLIVRVEISLRLR